MLYNDCVQHTGIRITSQSKRRFMQACVLRPVRPGAAKFCLSPVGLARNIGYLAQELRRIRAILETNQKEAGGGME